MNRYEELLKKSGVNEKDVERKALFYILANNDDLYSKIHHLYNFQHDYAETDCFEKGLVDFTSGSSALIRLGFNLFNGYKDNKSDVLNILSKLDSDNFELAMEAIQIRFHSI